MDELNITNILNRNEQGDHMRKLLEDFAKNKYQTNIKRGIYVYGKPGTGKTEFVREVLKSMDYDIVAYDAGDIRNKNIIDTITQHNMTDRNVMSMFHGKVRRIAIVMDEIDGMNSGDKGGINTLIKLVREKKTKKQKLEEITYNPIICIGDYHIDKKIKELMSVCHTIELKEPSQSQIDRIVSEIMPNLPEPVRNDITVFSQGDLRCVTNIHRLYTNDVSLVTSSLIRSLFHVKCINADTKTVTKKMINEQFSIGEHNTIINETDRTIVGLLWHENIIDMFSKISAKHSVPVYVDILKNICYADYVDRVTFQKQIWQFNEMSSIIKTFYTHKIYHDFLLENKDVSVPVYNPAEVRFTKVLTKYSTEYNNTTFIQFLCHQLGMDKKDIQSFFLSLKKSHEVISDATVELFDNCEITKLDINRMYRYLDKCIQSSNMVNEEQPAEVEY